MIDIDAPDMLFGFLAHASARSREKEIAAFRPVEIVAGRREELIGRGFLRDSELFITMEFSIIFAILL